MRASNASHPPFFAKILHYDTFKLMPARKKSKSSFANTVKKYLKFDTSTLMQDLIAGITVSLILIPQSLAYAQLAGLPAEYGLYAALLPPLIAALLGSSRHLSSGPVAIVSLMSATAIGALAVNSSPEFVIYTAILAFGLGVFQLLLGTLKLGALFNFISHPVVYGFTNAAAIIIALTQLPKFFGVSVGNYEHLYQTVWAVIKVALTQTHLPTLALGVGTLILMYLIKKINPKLPYILIVVVIATAFAWSTDYHYSTRVPVEALRSESFQTKLNEYNDMLSDYSALHQQLIALEDKADVSINSPSTQLELSHQRLELEFSTERMKQELELTRQSLGSYRFLDLNSTATKFVSVDGVNGEVPENLQWRADLSNVRSSASEVVVIRGGALVGNVDAGLPTLRFPHIDVEILLKILPAIIVIALVGFAEANSVSQVVAVKTNQSLDLDKELIGQGLANISSSMSGGMPVAGSFTRTAANFYAGAKSKLSSVVVFLCVLVTILFLTKFLYYLPQVVLAAVIVLAVGSLLDVKRFFTILKSSKVDAAASILTFFATLYLAPNLEQGVFIGVVFSIGFYLYYQSKPRIVFLSKYKDGSFHDAHLFHLARCQNVAVVRFDADLFFANAMNLENAVINDLARHPKIKKIVLVCTGINELDTTGEEVLAELVYRLRKTKKDVFFSSLKEPVVEVLKRTGLYEKIGEDHIFSSAQEAVEHVTKRVHKHTKDSKCPLLRYEEVTSEHAHHANQFLAHLDYVASKI